MRQKERTIDDVGNIVWKQLDDLEKNILTYMGSKKFVNRRELEEHTKKSKGTVLKRLNHLIELGVIKQNGRPRDPQQSYELLNKMQ